MRPLIVFTGQGLALSDNFNLAGLLQGTPIGAGCWRAAPGATSLDNVFSVTGHRSAKTLHQLIWTTQALCADAQVQPPREHHTRLFSALGRIASARLVLHLTTNIDGLTTRAAARYGAEWAPLTREATIQEINGAVLRACRANCGFLHLPLHGEAGLAARKGAQYDGGRCLWTPERGAQVNAYSTLAQGVGESVLRIEELMVVSRDGYKLLRALVCGSVETFEGGFTIRPREPAELLVLGYGAGASPARADYPFERSIEGVLRSLGTPRGWRAMVHTSADPAVCTWYEQRRFEVIEYSTDLADQAVSTLT
jgi:hypothetical protein